MGIPSVLHVGPVLKEEEDDESEPKRNEKIDIF